MTPQAPLPWPLGLPHMPPHPLCQRRNLGRRKMTHQVTQTSQIDLKRSICENFFLLRHDFFAEICVSKNSKFEFLEPKLTIKGDSCSQQIINQRKKKQSGNPAKHGINKDPKII
ncbi:hypothetical protein AABB24_020309 [Solanum stoloniferum]|uniref:Uncharacterized protein n=1 Tax=Solanum stoloniferum TaxID=62892 RepID=A0ABD2T7F8_9SOLN